MSTYWPVTISTEPSPSLIKNVEGLDVTELSLAVIRAGGTELWGADYKAVIDTLNKNTDSILFILSFVNNALTESVILRQVLI